MNLLKLRPAEREPERRIEPPTGIPYARKPKPAPTGPHVLGNTTLQALDQITEMSAAEIENVAERLEQAAHETAEGLRECARRMRFTGVLAQERVGNFVRVAVTCTDAARLMQQSVEQRDEPQPEPPPTQAPPADDTKQPIPVVTADHLAKVEAAVAEVMSKPGAADGQT